MVIPPTEMQTRWRASWSIGFMQMWPFYPIILDDHSNLLADKSEYISYKPKMSAYTTWTRLYVNYHQSPTCCFLFQPMGTRNWQLVSINIRSSTEGVNICALEEQFCTIMISSLHYTTTCTSKHGVYALWIHVTLEQCWIWSICRRMAEEHSNALVSPWPYDHGVSAYRHVVIQSVREKTSVNIVGGVVNWLRCISTLFWDVEIPFVYTISSLVFLRYSRDRLFNAHRQSWATIHRRACDPWSQVDHITTKYVVYDSRVHDVHYSYRHCVHSRYYRYGKFVYIHQTPCLIGNRLPLIKE